MSEYVVFHRGAFFEWLGAIALPPGSCHDTNADCAIIVAELIQWVDTHDLGDLYLFGQPA